MISYFYISFIYNKYLLFKMINKTINIQKLNYLVIVNNFRLNNVSFIINIFKFHRYNLIVRQSKITIFFKTVIDNLS